MASYTRLSKIDSGGFGCVYRVRRDDDAIVAFKVLEGGGTDPDDVARFGREVRIQSQLEHPNIVPILGSNLTLDKPFFVMPLAASNLRSRINPGGYGKDLRDVVGAFIQVLDGMAYAHDNGVVHRDLKPENVLFFEEDIFGDEILKIADFGLGKRMDVETLTITQSHVGMGTAAYMPPEQYEDFKHADQRADIYSLGKILYEMLTGQLPLHINLKHQALPPGFNYVIGKCVEHDPGKRYQSVLELKKDIAIVTSEQRKLTHPEKEFETLLAKIEELSEVDTDLIDVLDSILAENNDDEAFYVKAFMKLSEKVLQFYWGHVPERFVDRLSIYDQFVSGRQPFAFTDRVANFYRTIWGVISDLRVRRLILDRLLDMGWGHSRWHVGEVFGKLIASITDGQEGLMARDVLQQKPGAAEWIRSYCTGGLLPVIKDGFPEEQGDGSIDL
jgi:serine/threonine protein kinase